jgi:hypothetical protein
VADRRAAPDIVAVGGLIGTKVVLNEFVAYVQLADIQEGLTDKGRLIATYALCGFANISSIAIQIGGIGGIAPSRRPHIAQLGLKAVLGGNPFFEVFVVLAGERTFGAGFTGNAVLLVGEVFAPLLLGFRWFAHRDADGRPCSVLTRSWRRRRFRQGVRRKV